VQYRTKKETRMDWIPVESSQIACLGYEPEAEYPLGVMFKPTRKQQAAGQPGAVYEYAGITAQLFAEFMAAESKGQFFDRRIKGFAGQYPYRKVDTKVDMGPVNTVTDEL
jgi:hypothetical protein